MKILNFKLLPHNEDLLKATGPPSCGCCITRECRRRPQYRYVIQSPVTGRQRFNDSVEYVPLEGEMVVIDIDVYSLARKKLASTTAVSLK